MKDFDVIERLLNERWSCRGFTNQPVDQRTLDCLVRAAQRSPSWCNTQPWNVVITSPDETARLRKALAADDRRDPDFPFPLSYEGVHAERRRESGWQLYDAVGVAKGDRDASAREMMRNFEFFGAPHVAIVTTTATLGVYGAIDCGIYVQSFLLASHALGLGACPQAAIAARAEVLREHFALDPDRLVVCAIAFGHPDPDHPANSFRTTRANLSSTVTQVG